MRRNLLPLERHWPAQRPVRRRETYLNKKISGNGVWTDQENRSPNYAGSELGQL